MACTHRLTIIRLDLDQLHDTASSSSQSILWWSEQDKAANNVDRKRQPCKESIYKLCPVEKLHNVVTARSDILHAGHDTRDDAVGRFLRGHT